jgi:type III pantothenate kinase
VKNLVIDIGNSRVKVAWFEGYRLQSQTIFSKEEDWYKVLLQPHDNTMVSSVAMESETVLNKSAASGKKIHLTAQTPLPIQVQYATPETLGVDRLAAACGAWQLFPEEDCLVIDAGTCINYEFVDNYGVYWGGIIAPGVAMRFNAMHTFTARLPLLQAEPVPALLGNSTQSCMQSGVMNGTLAEMRGIIEQMKRQHPRLRVILCGGDAHLFENQLKPSIFAAPELVLVGLNRILNHNVSL